MATADEVLNGKNTHDATDESLLVDGKHYGQMHRSIDRRTSPLTITLSLDHKERLSRLSVYLSVSVPNNMAQWKQLLMSGKWYFKTLYPASSLRIPEALQISSLWLTTSFSLLLLLLWSPSHLISFLLSLNISAVFQRRDWKKFGSLRISSADDGNGEEVHPPEAKDFLDRMQVGEWVSRLVNASLCLCHCFCLSFISVVIFICDEAIS